MASFISHSSQETEALGESWGREAESGQVIALCGELGAGKTRLVKGLARGLGVTACVHSPSFTLVNQYRGGRLPLFHLDLYRLETPEQIVAAGLEEYLQTKGVTVIEWAEKLSWVEGRGEGARPRGPHQRTAGTPSLPLKNWRNVNIEIISATERRIAYEDFGA